MTHQADAESFCREAEERLRQREKAVSPLDRESWLRLAGECSKIAKVVERIVR